jgi:hypothetical protein
VDVDIAGALEADDVTALVDAIVLRQPPLGFVDVSLGGFQRGEALLQRVGFLAWAEGRQQEWMALLHQQRQWPELQVESARIACSEDGILVGLGVAEDYLAEY